MKNLKLPIVFVGCWLTLAACAAPTQTTSNGTTPVNTSTTQANTVRTESSRTSSETTVKTVLPTDVDWKSNPNLPGVQNASVIGDSTKPEQYVLFGKMEKGTQFPAHSHPDARITTVISGTMYYGTGDHFEENRVKAYPAGSVVFTPAGTTHFMWAKDGETIMQETGYGPTGLNMTAKTK